MSASKCICDWPTGCNNLGTLECNGCGGDQCVCRCGGEQECPGCDECEGAERVDEEETP